MDKLPHLLDETSIEQIFGCRMAGHSEDDGGDAKQKAQPFGELHSRIPKVQTLCFADSKHALNEPSPPVVAEDA